MDTISRDRLLRFTQGSTIKNYRLQSSSAVGGSGGSTLTPLGEGGSGVVYLAAQTLHENVEVKRAIKFFMYRDDIAVLTAHRQSTPVSREDFLTEVVNIASLSHENLIKVIDAGMHPADGLEIPYIVTEYIQGPTLRDVIGGRAPLALSSVLANPALLLDILIHIGHAVQHLHTRGFSHCDIAPKNIFLNEAEAYKPVLGDLGLAKNVHRPREQVFIAGSREYMPDICLEYLNQYVPWGSFLAMHPCWDLYALARTGLELVSVLNPDLPLPWRRAAVTCFEECAKQKRYHRITEVIDRLQFLRRVHREVATPELSASVSEVRRLMPVAPLTTSRRMGRLAQHPALLRLTGVPQLATTLIFFPSATHTRYEHSLGVMETIRRYLMALLDHEEFLEHLSVEKIETALICGLFSNLTRFPMSNVLHEIKHKNEG